MLRRSGNFGRVGHKLRELASGDWKGKSVSKCAGTKKQKLKMAIPILEAPVIHTNELFILWHLDVGFYENLPWVQQQIVKGSCAAINVWYRRPVTDICSLGYC